jgi:hypothetical protein
MRIARIFDDGKPEQDASAGTLAAADKYSMIKEG